MQGEGAMTQRTRPGAAMLRRGWWRRALRRRSPHANARPPGEAVSLLVVHSISLPAGQFGGDAVERLFMGTLDTSSHADFAPLDGLRVSAHFFIRRDGACLQFVSCDARAWHAGVSSWLGRGSCNDFSIGVELEGLEGDCFEAAQMATLAELARDLAARYPLRHVAGHEHIAPGRKADPGAGFDWDDLQARLGWPKACFAPWTQAPCSDE